MENHSLAEVVAHYIPYFMPYVLVALAIFLLKPQMKRNKGYMEEMSVFSKRQADALERIAIALEKMDGK